MEPSGLPTPSRVSSGTLPTTLNAIVEAKDRASRDIRDVLKDKNARVGISFSGCGFLGVYHFGVIDCFRKNAKSFLPRVTHIAGSSVGSLLAALMVFRPDALDSGLENLILLADELNTYTLGALHPGLNLADRLSHIVDEYIPEDVTVAQGRLFISVTRQSDHTNRMINEFPDRDYLRRCLLASCYIPVYMRNTPPQLDGEHCIDGSFSNNLPIFDDVPTLTISPFSGYAIISPTDQNMLDWHATLGHQVIKINLQNIVRGVHSLFPPSAENLRTYFARGYNNAMRWLIEQELIDRDEGSEV